MNIVVCIKHAVDESELRADAGGKPQLQGAQAKMSTFDRNAVEEAVKVKEAKTGTVAVVSLGNGDWKKSIKEALAMGCDRAVAVNSADQQLDTIARAGKYFSRGQIVLHGQNFSRGHERGLEAVLNHDGGRLERHNRLSASDIAL